MALHWWTNFGAEKCRNGVPGCDGKPPVAEPDRKKEESQRGSGGRSPRRVRAEPCLPNDLVGKLLSTGPRKSGVAVGRRFRWRLRARRAIYWFMEATATSSEVLTRYRGREIRPADIALIRERIEEAGASGVREAIARSICEAWDWRQPGGKLATRACRDLLLRLEEWGHIELPARGRKAEDGPRRRKRLPLLTPDLIPLIEVPLGPGEVDLSALVVRPIVPEERYGWRLYMDRYHYLGCRPIVGEHLLYAAELDEVVVALLGWASAAFRAPLRENYIGWDDAARRARLHLIADNIRFLVFPWVRVPHLASKILATNLRRLSPDWEQVWGHPVHLAETFVDTARFRGTCYRASNWIYLGQTAGRSKRGNEYLHAGSPKALFVYPLHRRAQSLLAGEPQAGVVTAPKGGAEAELDKEPCMRPLVGACAHERPVGDEATAWSAIQVSKEPIHANLVASATAPVTVGEGTVPTTAAAGVLAMPATDVAQAQEPDAQPALSSLPSVPLRAPRGRKKTRIQIALSPAEMDVLQRRARGLVLPHREVVRAKIILLLAAGGTPSAIAREVGCSRRIVHKWGERFIRKRLKGLVDDERSGRPPRFSPRSRSSPRQAGL